MSEVYHSSNHNNGNCTNGSNRGNTAAPTRARKRIYDSETNTEEIPVSVSSRRLGLYTGYHETVKGVAPYKKGERLARYGRRSETINAVTPSNSNAPTSTSVSTASTFNSTVFSTYDPSKSPMMEDEDVNHGLADDFDDSLCGLGSDMCSTYNMSEATEALNDLQSVQNIKKENLSAVKVDSMMSVEGHSPVEISSPVSLSSAVLFDDTSQNSSIDRLLNRLLSSDFESQPHSLSLMLNQGLIGQSSLASPFSPPSANEGIFSDSPSASLHFSTQLFNNPYVTTENSSIHHQSSTSSTNSPGDEDNSDGGLLLPLHSNELMTEVQQDALKSDACDSQDSSRRGSNELHQRCANNSSLLDNICPDNKRFQYILGVPTSTAVKRNEDSLSYLNQGQPYEIKIKKLGDITKCVGKKFTSLIRICFHERKLQYSEKEQLDIWQRLRPNERILEVDVPLSYGITDVKQPSDLLNVCQFDWDPNKDVAAYIKVNCISTEFTQRKHGGEKGVPFRIQVETYSSNTGQLDRLNVCGCQIKVFKLKGADRKHKQDREKIAKLSSSDRDKYQESCDCTILNTYSGEYIYNPTGDCTPEEPPPTFHSPEAAVSPPAVTPMAPISVTPRTSPSPINAPILLMQPSPLHHSSEPKVSLTLTGNESSSEVQQWLNTHRFFEFQGVFANFSATDILCLSRSEMIEICGVADGIRLFNTLHCKRVVPRITLYVCKDGESVYSAVYLERATYKELVRKVSMLVGLDTSSVLDAYIQGPNGIHVKVNDDVVRNLRDESQVSCTLLPSTPPTSFSLLFKLVVKDHIHLATERTFPSPPNKVCHFSGGPAEGFIKFGEEVKEEESLSKHLSPPPSSTASSTPSPIPSSSTAIRTNTPSPEEETYPK